MALTERPGRPGLGHQQPQRAGSVELFFDLVFVFAFTRLSGRLTDNLTWAGFYAAFLLLMAMWSIWYRTALTTNRYDPSRPVIQVMVLGTMFGGLIVAAALPKAFNDRGAIFATVYVVVQLARPLWLTLFAGQSGRLISIRVLFWAAISTVPWVSGIFADRDGRVMWWTFAVLLDYLGLSFDFPMPRIGRAPLRYQRIAEEHLAERYQQVLIIALGEVILTTGAYFDSYGFALDRSQAFVVSFIITTLIWQIYFYRAGRLLHVAIAKSRTPASVGKVASYAHLLMVAGVSLSGVGGGLTIDHPSGPAEPAWVLVIFGGPALFLIGRGILDYATFSRVSWSRPIGLLLFAALTPVAFRLPPILVAVLAAVVLAGIAIANILSWRWFPSTPTPPSKQPSATER